MAETKKYIQFADDTTVYCKGKETIQLLRFHAEQAQAQFSSNELALNQRKTVNKRIFNVNHD